MQTLRKAYMITILTGFAALFLHASIAYGANNKQDVNALKEAALELRATDAKLSDSLMAYYEKEKDETVEWLDLDDADKKDELSYEKNGIGILEQAVVKLKITNPSLAEKIATYIGQEKAEIAAN